MFVVNEWGANKMASVMRRILIGPAFKRAHANSEATLISAVAASYERALISRIDEALCFRKGREERGITQRK